MDLQQLKQLLKDRGVKRLFAKELAANDNSKNQPYFGGDFEVLSLFPMKKLEASTVGINKNLKAELDFSWILPSGELVIAPHAKLILYPQYPEVRFSGFLLGCRSSSDSWDSMRRLMSMRLAGRVLFLGVTETDKIIGFVVDGDSQIATEFHAQIELSSNRGVFFELLLPQSFNPADSRTLLLSELGRIHRLGWILSKQLDSHGVLKICNAPQCGGLTLEAELNISKNSSVDPDFANWEIKQHGVSNFLRPQTSKAITMMTPEPTGGYYREQGVEAFVRRFGYADRNGVADRLNFGGIFRYSVRHPLTGLTMKLSGYDPTSKKITDPNGEIQLVNDQGVVAASWGFAGIIAHWSRKHAQAAFVPSQVQKIPPTSKGEKLMYRYGNTVRLAEHTNSLKVIDAIASGDLYYDPAIKIVNQSQADSEIKRRSQWRVASKKIGSLYESVTPVTV